MDQFRQMSLLPEVAFYANGEGFFYGGDRATMEAQRLQEGFELLTGSQVRDFWRDRDMVRARLVASSAERVESERAAMREALVSELKASNASDSHIELTLKLHGLL